MIYTDDGTKYDPIPFDGNVELVGLYVEIV